MASLTLLEWFLMGVPKRELWSSVGTFFLLSNHNQGAEERGQGCKKAYNMQDSPAIRTWATVLCPAYFLKSTEHSVNNLCPIFNLLNLQFNTLLPMNKVCLKMVQYALNFSEMTRITLLIEGRLDLSSELYQEAVPTRKTMSLGQCRSWYLAQTSASTCLHL